MKFLDDFCLGRVEVARICKLKNFLKIGIIGAGGMLQYHAAGFLQAGATIYAICDQFVDGAKQ